MSEFPVALDQWLQTPLAGVLIDAESKLLSAAFEEAHGFELLQMGVWGFAPHVLAASRTRRQTVVGREASGDADVRARLTQLPLPSGSMDVVLLPHTLEIAADPKAVLREADRVLVGEGQIFILGFAWLGPWGLRSLCTRGGFPPGLQRLLSERRLRDWLTLLGYEVARARPYLYRLPRQSLSSQPATTASMLRRGLLNPWPASAYLLRARKRIATVTPLRPRWREQRRALVTGLAGTST